MEIDWSKAPEGATHYLKWSPQPWRDLSGDNWLWFFSGEWHGPGDKSILKNTSAALILSQGDELVPRPITSSSWAGEGLPPVGTVCEFVGIDSSDWHRELRNGAEVTIIAHFDGPNQRLAAFTFDCIGGLQVEQGTEACFTPIRTAEQKAAEERDKGIEQMVQDLTYTDKDDFEFIRCGVLWDAGYRKQVQP